MNFSVSTKQVDFKALLSLLTLQSVCLAGFLYFFSTGKKEFAWLIYIAPFQILFLMVLFHKVELLLLTASIVAPLAVCQLIPNDYHQFIFFPSIIGLLILLRFTSWGKFNSSKGSWGCLLPPERFVGPGLLIWIVISFIVAVIRGTIEHFFIICNVLIWEVFILGYFFAIVPRDVQRVKELINAIAAGVVVCVILLPLLVRYSAGFVDTFGGKKLSVPFGILDLNALGMLIATLTSALLGIVLGERRFLHRLYLSFVVVILLIGLVFTRSRGAWFGMGIALLYLLFKTRSPILGAITGAGGVFVIVFSFFRSLFISRLEGTSLNDPAFIARLILWNFGLLVARKNWLFGVGWENFRFIKYIYGYPRFADPKVYFSTHNLYLEMMADLGLVGFLLFVILLFGTIIRTNRLAGKMENQFQYIALGVTAALIAFAAHSFFDSLSSTFMVIGMWFGIAMALRRLASNSSAGANDFFG